MKTLLIPFFLTILCINSYSQKYNIDDNYSKTTYNNLNILQDENEVFLFETKYKSEHVLNIVNLNNDSVVIKTRYKDKSKKQKYSYAYYLMTMSPQVNIEEKTDEQITQYYDDLFYKHSQKFCRLSVYGKDSFTEKTAKDKANKVGKFGKELAEQIMTGGYVKSYVEKTAIFLDNINDTLIITSLLESHEKWDNSKFICSIKSEQKKFMTTYGVLLTGKDIAGINIGAVTDNSFGGGMNVANNFGHELSISSNGEYGIYKLIFFDFKNNNYYRLHQYKLSGNDGVYKSWFFFDKQNKRIVSMSRRGFFGEKHEITIYSLKPEWTKKLTEETNMEEFLAAQNKSGLKFKAEGDNIIYSDEKDNNSISIGNQIWMTENMNVGEMIIGKSNQEDNSIIEKYCYDNDEENCEKYGALYQWNEAMVYNPENSKGICPQGWHIPSVEEWTVLINFLGGKKQAGGKMKKEEQSLWKVYSENSNISGFSAVPGGYRSKAGGMFRRVGVTSNMRTCTNGGSILIDTKQEFAETLRPDKQAGFSVRCIKN